MDHHGKDNPEGNTYHAAGNADDRSFREKLEDDIPLRGSRCTPDPYFFCPFHDRGQHNIHNADAAYNQRNAGNNTQDDIEDIFSPLLLF